MSKEEVKPAYTLSVTLQNDEMIDLSMKDLDRPTFIRINKFLGDPDPLKMIAEALRLLCVGGEIDKVLDDWKAVKSCDSAIGSMLHAEPATLKKN